MEELDGRQVWRPVKVKLRPPADTFTPSRVIYKPSRRGVHQNVIHKIANSEGKCYEFAFVRSFARFDADKYVCSACRVLKMQNPELFQNYCLPYVRVSHDNFQTNPEYPTNANHFCKPKVFVDVIHAGEMSSLRHSVLESVEIKRVSEEIATTSVVSPSPREDPSTESAPHHPSSVESIFDEHNYASTSTTSRPWENKDNYANAASLNKFPQFSNEPLIRVPSSGASKIIYMLPYAKENCYEFFERKSRSVYFDVYACAGCNKVKESLGSTVGPVPTVHVRGDHYMTDPMRPRHRHYCVPKVTNEQVVQGEMLRLMRAEGNAIKSFEELLKAIRASILSDDGAEEFPHLNEYLNAFAQDRRKVAIIERRYGFKRQDDGKKPLTCAKSEAVKSTEGTSSEANALVMQSAKRRSGDEEGSLSLAQKEAREKKEREKMEANARRKELIQETPFPVESPANPSLTVHKPPTVAPPEATSKPAPVNAPTAVAFGLQKRVIVSRLAPPPSGSNTELKRKPGWIPVMYPVKVHKVEETTQSQKTNPPSLSHKDEDFVDVEGC